jgi:hypothetical protein
MVDHTASREVGAARRPLLAGGWGEALVRRASALFEGVAEQEQKGLGWTCATGKCFCDEEIPGAKRDAGRDLYDSQWAVLCGKYLRGWK